MKITIDVTELEKVKGQCKLQTARLKRDANLKKRILEKVEGCLLKIEVMG